jgi:hypothetical protein
LPAGLVLLACLGGLTSPSTAAARGDPPEWAERIAPGTWGIVSRNTLAEVDPARDARLKAGHERRVPWRGSTGQASVVDAWNGGAMARDQGSHGVLLLFGGGHSNYFGNEVYAFDLGRASWSRLTDPYVAPTASLLQLYERAEFPDGSPLPPHTYDYVEYHPATRSFVVLRGVQKLGVPSGPYSSGPPHMLGLETLRWRRGASHGLTVGSGGLSCYDGKRQLLWSEAPGSRSAGLRSFDPSGQNADGSYGKWSADYGHHGVVVDSVGACDPLHDLLVFTRFRRGNEVMAIALSEPGRPAMALRQAGTPPPLEPAHGWEWSETRRALIYWRRGGGVHELAAPPDDWRGTWQWRALTAGANSIAPDEMKRDNGVYGRFRIVRYGDEEFCIVVNSVDGPVYAFHLPDLGTSQ